MADDILVGLGDRWQAHHATTAGIEDDDRLRAVERRLDAIEVKMLREGARTAKGLAAKLEVAHSLAVQSRCEEDALRMLASALRDCRRMAAVLLLAVLVPLLAGGPSRAFQEEALSPAMREDPAAWIERVAPRRLRARFGPSPRFDGGLK